MNFKTGEKILKSSMQFPSSSPDRAREGSDLGRFGLGMKTASFSQTRRFTVLSRLGGEDTYIARTWDVDLLKNRTWRLLVNEKDEIDEIVSSYQKLSNECINGFDEFLPNTIVPFPI